MYSTLPSPTNRKRTLSSGATTDTDNISETYTNPNQAWIECVRNYIEKTRIVCVAAQAVIYANRLGCKANDYFEAARENHELAQDLNPDDAYEWRDLDALKNQADEYRSYARKLQSQAELLRSRAEQLRLYKSDE